MTIKVENMQSANGNDVPNQFIIIDESDGIIKSETFQSYRSVIAVKRFNVLDQGMEPIITLDQNKWDYSVTTGKYRNQFLGEGIAETRAKIKSGEYGLANLN